MPGLLDLIGKVSPQQYFQFGAGVLSQPSNVGAGIQQGLLGASQAKEKLEERKRKEQLQAAIGDVSLPLELRNLLSSLPPDQAGGVLAQYMMQGQGERKIIKGADGYNYYADTQERVLPGVQAPAGGQDETYSHINLFDRDTEQVRRGRYNNKSDQVEVLTEDGWQTAGPNWVKAPNYQTDSSSLTDAPEDWDRLLVTTRNSMVLSNQLKSLLSKPGTLTGVLGRGAIIAEGFRDQIQQLSELTNDDTYSIENGSYDYGAFAQASAEVKSNLRTLAYMQAKLNDPDARLTDRDVKDAMDQLTAGGENSRIVIISLLNNFDKRLFTNLQSVQLLGRGGHNIPDGYFDNIGGGTPTADDPLSIR